MAVIRIALDWRVCVRVGLQQLLDISNRAHEKEVARVVEKAEMLEEALLVRNDADVLLQVLSAPYKRALTHTAWRPPHTRTQKPCFARALARALAAVGDRECRPPSHTAERRPVSAERLVDVLLCSALL